MMYHLRAQAEADVAEIWRYTASRWGAKQADKYYASLIDGFRSLAANPNLGRSCEEIRPGYRRHSVGAHVVFYKADGAEVDIVRILHSRRDFQQHLPA